MPAQKPLLDNAFVRPARSMLSALRIAAGSTGARHLLRISDATFACNDFAARRAVLRLPLHFLALVTVSARLTKAASRSSVGSREQRLHLHSGCGGSVSVARTMPMAHSTPASESSVS